MSDEPRRRRPMSRIGDIIPATAARLGLEGELRRARATATFDAIVAELAPAAHGACRAIGVVPAQAGIDEGVEGQVLVVEADAPIVAQELRLNASALASAFAAAPAGTAISGLRVTVRRRPQSDQGRVR
ncbi:MAG: DUF721 domain-containing protein [Chloroflexi bacterium]|nr:DUF721 domain-containing protein [Chloroflexota bacterium]